MSPSTDSECNCIEYIRHMYYVLYIIPILLYYLCIFQLHFLNLIKKVFGIFIHDYTLSWIINYNNQIWFQRITRVRKFALVRFFISFSFSSRPVHLHLGFLFISPDAVSSDFVTKVTWNSITNVRVKYQLFLFDVSPPFLL